VNPRAPEGRGPVDPGHPADPPVVHDMRRRSPAATSMPMWRRARPGISLANGVGRLVEYPIRRRSVVNMILSASEQMIKDNPSASGDRRDAKEGDRLRHGESRPDDRGSPCRSSASKRKSIETHPHVELTWKSTASSSPAAKAYSELMLDKKQIRQLPTVKAITAKSCDTTRRAYRRRP